MKNVFSKGNNSLGSQVIILVFDKEKGDQQYANSFYYAMVI